MSVTLSNITTAVDPFNDIPDITFDSIDITAFTEEVEIYTNTPAVMIPTKLNAMAGSMKTWLNDNISAPLENQQNTFKNEVIIRTNTAMNAVETYMNDEVQGFVNTVFVPWANDAGNILSNHANILETNVTGTISQLQSDYTLHVESQDAIIQQALDDILSNIAQYTSGAADSGYSIHQTNELLADVTMTREIGFDNYKYNAEGQITFAEEGPNRTHHISYNKSTGGIQSFGESMQIEGEPRPFVQHLKLEQEASTGSTSITKIKAYDINKYVSTTNVNSFRGTGHEEDGTPAVELTILNNTSIADTDNPELVLRRGIDSAMMWGSLDDGDFITITNLDGSIYNEGIVGQYAQNYDTTLFKPYSSYCHDSTSSVTGWGVDASMNAIDIDSSGGLYDTPVKCEMYKDSNVALLDDLSRSYEFNIAGESYDSDLSDGLIYNVYINDDSGFIDSYAYTIDANGKQDTGAILNAVYDNGVSDVTITNRGTKYSKNSSARAFDLGAVDVTGSIETKAVATHTLKNGMVDEILITNAGAGYTGYYEIIVPEVPGGDGHTHTLQFSQAIINQIKAGTPQVGATVEAGHSHDITVAWNDFNNSFILTQTVGGGHDHEMTITTHNVNPTITVAFTTNTGGLADGYVVLAEDGTVDEVIITNGGADYGVGDTVSISGGAPATPAQVSMNLADGGIASIAVSDQGTGYTDNTAKTVQVDIQNNTFTPSVISVNVGDTIDFTNLDIQAHTVTHTDGMFNSGDIPQNATFSYTVTKDTELTDRYDIVDENNTETTATLWVRENTVFVEMNTTTGGGLRGLGTINASGNLIDITVDNPGKGYNATDTVRIIDVSGPGEGAYASVETNRSIGAVTVVNKGTGYSENTQILAFDPTGTPIIDSATGLETGRTYGSGAILRPNLTTEYVPAVCSDSQFLVQADCEGAGATWNAEITIGEIIDVNVADGGSNYNDIQLIINDPAGTGAGGSLTPDVNNIISDVSLTNRGSNYNEPIIIISDPSGKIGTTLDSTIGGGFAGTVTLNNGIGSATIVEDWQNYIDGQTRVIVVDADPIPTGYGATGTVQLGAAGNVSSITFTNPGTAYKQPVVVVAGPVSYTGASINNVNTDLALYGPEGNTDNSPFSANNTAGTNFKNGIMIQFENPNGHSMDDYWTFKCQSWKKGTPDSLLYTSSRYDGNNENMRGIITLKDVWDV